MTINPIGITNPNQALDPSSFQTRMQQALSPVATLFGESTDQLMSELNSGHTSLSALAANKGITQAQLVDAIKQGLQQSSPNNGQSMSDTQLTNIANRIANHKHGGHHHHGGGGGVSATDGTTSSTDPTTALTSTSATSSSSTTTADSSTQQLLQLLEAQSQNQSAFDQSL